MWGHDDWCPTLNGKSLNLFQIFCDYFPCVNFLKVFDEFYFNSLLSRPLDFVLIKPPILFAAIRTPHFKTPICHLSQNHTPYHTYLAEENLQIGDSSWKLLQAKTWCPIILYQYLLLNHLSKILVPLEKINLPAPTLPLVVGPECVDSQRAATSD